MSDLEKDIITFDGREYHDITNKAKNFVAEKSPAYTIQAWLRSNNTIQYFKIWEEYHNPNLTVKAAKNF